MRTGHPSSDTRLVLSGVTKRYDDTIVLNEISLTVKPGEKVGVIGDNGSGKSTLLRLLAGRSRPDNGSVTVAAPGGVGYLAQASDLPATALVGDAVDLALADLRDLERRIRRAELGLDHATPAELTGYGDLVALFEARGGYQADTRVEIMLDALGLPGLDRDRPLGTLSGGQRSRLALAATLAAAPEVLLLDEPTNDLDDQAVAWLENHLRNHRGTLVAVTHDRLLLDRTTSTIVEVDHDLRTVHRYGNGYTGFLAAKAAARARWAREHQEWRTEVTRQEGLADSHAKRLAAIPRKAPAAFSGAGAFRARSRAHGAMSRIRGARERLRRLRLNPVPPPPLPLRFTPHVRAHATAADVAGPLVELTDVRVGERLHVESLRIEPGARLLVTGPNGAGKTTLLRVLAGELAPDTGTVRRVPRVGHLRQHDGTAYGGGTVLEAFAAGRPGDPAEHADALLALGLFRATRLASPVRSLSPGLLRRLELARIISEPTDLLLLDEPTNHLSPDLMDDLEDALTAYPGSLVIVTHDRRMRDAFTGSRLELDAGRAVPPQVTA
ncbi:ABC transporter ATP-binding protein [Planomonospora parontospora subsp. parontospora]|uniref:ABC transporter ATP-binding protein n=2 Tax=Planomonospora parontospora TaxID=58119 RepID=A0AA37BK91_9ACTN|nr:ABC-F family ATP-binding cassette domain-containing protein [Planomonospora parontospora]GGK81650.1 ABC transporter ATP-binding protein [Planomonospora parontospora]GII11043.1 ABC transporter ATP-binding protein [Planomonospora parontospora subsp. parontospora]